MRVRDRDKEREKERERETDRQRWREREREREREKEHLIFRGQLGSVCKMNLHARHPSIRSRNLEIEEKVVMRSVGIFKSRRANPFAIWRKANRLQQNPELRAREYSNFEISDRFCAHDT
jgi:hypothetical protein